MSAANRRFFHESERIENIRDYAEENMTAAILRLEHMMWRLEAAERSCADAELVAPSASLRLALQHVTDCRDRASEMHGLLKRALEGESGP